ncbi:MAG: bifunctional oligoribonuclease/PAP phosphatase NrnA [Acidobacteria bacterium]|nr:bifunctional oligoribonuclease/PAP phosphatase NrnA [Acidobacteriota bacterium]
MTTTGPGTRRALLDAIAGVAATGQRFLVTAHVKPDGDSIGSQLALALALRACGKDVRIVNRDSAPPPLQAFPGVADIECRPEVDGDFDAVFVLECGDLERTGLAGLERFVLVNIDHHPGNTSFGAVNWFDGAAAACGEMVFDVIGRLGVPLSVEIATHLYVAILTDTGSFHYSSLSPRTFDICRQLLEAGVDPVAVARTVYDSNTVGRLRLFGTVMNTLEVDRTGRRAVIRLDREMARASGGEPDDAEGLINLPLTVPEIQAVAFFREADNGQLRVGFRSKVAIDVGAVAGSLGGGGHRNAAGCTVTGTLDEVRDRILPLLDAAIERGLRNR